MAAIIIYLAAMVGIGLYAWRKTKTGEDFMLAGRDLKPGVAALSAGASDMSGWLLMGLPGALYVSGLVEAWIAIGLTVGAWLNWFIIAPRLRAYTVLASNSITVPSFLGHRFRDKTNLLRIVSSIIILVFFTFYVASMLVSAGKFFQSSFSWPYLVGMLVVGAITVGYTLFGGFLGVSLTDVAQGLLMFAALIAVPIVATVHLGGPARVMELIGDAHNSTGTNYLSLTGDGLSGATWLVILSGLGWGLGYFGQPHILARFIALRSPQDAPTARRIGIGWMALCMVGAITTGLIGVAWFQNLGTPLAEADAETVFLQLSQILFHPFIAGLVLAAVLAAIMSTMSSQLIVCSSALVEDLYGLRAQKASPKTSLLLGRFGVLLVAIVGAVIALDPGSSILSLVGFAWAGFGSAFGPLLILGLFWRKVSAMGALSGMITGAVVAFVWGMYPPIKEALALYEIIPGFIACLVVTVVVSQFTRQTNPDVDTEFAEVKRLIKPGARPVVEAQSADA
ncbi:sodium/proline symporter PutP [Galactobacter caseinivorans]|nr:sodium/proline symporter PutP [Galactobacter caseinivorans]